MIFFTSSPCTQSMHAEEEQTVAMHMNSPGAAQSQSVTTRVQGRVREQYTLRWCKGGEFRNRRQDGVPEPWRWGWHLHAL